LGHGHGAVSAGQAAKKSPACRQNIGAISRREYCLCWKSQAQARSMKAKWASIFCALLWTATPALAQELAPLSAYGDLPGVEDMAISQDGKRIAAVSRIKQERKLLVTENGALVSATPIGDMKVRRLSWAGDDLVVLEKSDSYDLPLGFTARKAELFSAIALNVANQSSQLRFCRHALAQQGRFRQLRSAQDRRTVDRLLCRHQVQAERRPDGMGIRSRPAVPVCRRS
jgi:hypothetical protein